MHYSMFIQGSSTNGSFSWIYPYKYRNPTITSITVLFKQNPIKSYSTTWILPMWWQIPMTRSEQFPLDTTRSLKSLSSSTQWQMLHSPNLPRIRVRSVSGPSSLSPFISPLPRTFEKFSVRRTNDYSVCIILWIECDWYHSKSTSDPSELIVGPILRSEDCQPEQQSAYHNDHWQSHDQLLLIVRRHLHSNIIPIRSIDICVHGFERFQVSHASSD